MAEEPIRKDDIIDDSAIVSINELITALERLDKVFNQLHADTKDKAVSLFNSVQGVNPASPEGQAAMKSFITQAEQLQIQSKEENKLIREKTKLQEKLKTLYSDEAGEVAKLKVAIENKNKANKIEAQYVESAEGSINKMRAKLKELTAEYNKLAPAARNQAAPAINKLTEELKKAEGAIGNNTRGVGSYTKSIINAAKQMIGFVSPIALVTATLGKLKTAFGETEQGTKFFGKFNQGWKTFWQNLTTNMSMEEFAKSIGKATDVAEKLDEIRRGDREDLKTFAQLETDIAILRYKAADATLSETEQLEALTRAQEKEDKLIRLKIEDKQEELDAINDLLVARKNDATLLDRQAQLEAEIIQIQGERNLRLESRSSALRVSIIKNNKEVTEDEIKSAKTQLLGASMADLGRVESHLQASIEIGDIRDNELKHNEKLLEEQKRQVKAATDYEIQEANRAREEKQAIIDESFSIVSGSLSSLGDLYQMQKENELSAAGDNAKKREEIERNYAKKQQALQAGQALIDGAATIVSIWRKWAPISIPLAQLFSALSAATTIAQVAIIKSQKFAKGGSGVLFGPSHSSGGINVGIGEAEGGEHIAITSRKMTSRYGSKMLDAVSNSINQGKFFEVWANVNKEMGVSDPYTKKMYDLMTKTPTVYTDTNGNTVKEYPNGQKYVIRKIWNN